MPFIFKCFTLFLGLEYVFFRCVIAVVCRINQTIRCMLISSVTTMY